MNILFFLYFSAFFPSHSIHLCSFNGLSHFFHAVIILSHRHFLISSLIWLTGMFLSLDFLHSFSFSCSYSSCAELCSSFLLLLFHIVAMPQPFHFCYASIPKAVHLIPLTTAMTHPLSHGYRVWTYAIHIGRSSTYWVVYKGQRCCTENLVKFSWYFPPKQDRFNPLLHSYSTQVLLVENFVWLWWISSPQVGCFR